MLLRLRHLLIQKVSSRSLTSGGDKLNGNHQFLGNGEQVSTFMSEGRNIIYTTIMEYRKIYL
ncbi:MAG TPA: hypothetical protein DIU28_01805 [Anabaena sp. UBA12330]|nr:hypothetical protein [Anabaena sp. UBA12330]